MQVLIVYYSMYGHIHQMARAVAQGVQEVDGAEALVRQVPETITEEILGKMGALETRKTMAHIPLCT
jgi:NAD(P)H dehydrogenase (quinone)